MTNRRRAIRLDNLALPTLWCAPLVLLAHLGLASPAALTAQDTIQALEPAPAAVQDTLALPDSTVVPDPAVAAAAALTQRAEDLATEISVLWIEIDTLFQQFAHHLRCDLNPWIQCQDAPVEIRPFAANRRHWQQPKL